MARYASWMRPRYSPVYAICDNEKSANELTLSWGVTPFVMEVDFIDPQNTIESAMKSLTEKGHARKRPDGGHHRRHFLWAQRSWTPFKCGRFEEVARPQPGLMSGTNSPPTGTMRSD